MKKSFEKCYGEDEAIREASKMREKIEAGEAKNYGEAEKLVEAEKGHEKKEELAPLFLAYRDNDLFRKHIPEIVNKLKSLGREVRLQIFPEGTTKAEMEKWYKENENDLQGMSLVTDWTFGGAAISASGVYRGSKDYELHLDLLMEQAVQRAIFGTLPEEHEKAKSDHQQSQKSIEKLLYTDQQMFEEIFKRIQEKTGNGIKKIFIVNEKLTAHSDYFVGLVAKKLKRSVDDYDLKKYNQEYANYLKQWLQNAGVQEVYIVNFASEIPANISQEESAYIITDRHAKLPDYSKLKEKELNIPNANLFENAEKKFGVLVKSEELSSSIGKILEEKFSNLNKVEK